MFPADAGVIPMLRKTRLPCLRVPRECGGDLVAAYGDYPVVFSEYAGVAFCGILYGLSVSYFGCYCVIL